MTQRDNPCARAPPPGGNHEGRLMKRMGFVVSG